MAPTATPNVVTAKISTMEDEEFAMMDGGSFSRHQLYVQDVFLRGISDRTVVGSGNISSILLSLSGLLYFTTHALFQILHTKLRFLRIRLLNVFQ